MRGGYRAADPGVPVFGDRELPERMDQRHQCHRLCSVGGGGSGTAERSSGQPWSGSAAVRVVFAVLGAARKRNGTADFPGTTTLDMASQLLAWRTGDRRPGMAAQDVEQDRAVGCGLAIAARSANCLSAGLLLPVFLRLLALYDAARCPGSAKQRLEVRGDRSAKWRVSVLTRPSACLGHTRGPDHPRGRSERRQRYRKVTSARFALCRMARMP